MWPADTGSQRIPDLHRSQKATPSIMLGFRGSRPKAAAVVFAISVSVSLLKPAPERRSKKAREARFHLVEDE
jgi:hypothetical protein